MHRLTINSADRKYQTAGRPEITGDLLQGVSLCEARWLKMPYMRECFKTNNQQLPDYEI